MKKVINSSKYGDIVYSENFWTGKKAISINGVDLAKKSKNLYEYAKEDVTLQVEVKGNFTMGVKLMINDEEIIVTPAPKWYEIALSLIGFVLIMVWGNVPQLCSIVPVVGGAIGGLISGLLCMVNFVVITKFNKIWLKVLISVGFVALNFLTCYLVALLILAI